MKRLAITAALVDSDVWLNVNLCRAYYGRGYERGDLPLFVSIAEWLERQL